HSHDTTAFIAVMIMTLCGSRGVYLFLAVVIALFLPSDEKQYAKIKSHIDELVQSLGGGLVQSVETKTLKRLFRDENFPSMLGWIKNSMRLELRVGLRIVDGQGYKHPMWIEWTDQMPAIGTTQFNNTRVVINATRNILSEQPFGWVVAGFAHELAHVVLTSIGHPLEDDEKAVDLTAMILGYDDFIAEAHYTWTEWTGLNS